MAPSSSYSWATSAIIHAARQRSGSSGWIPGPPLRIAVIPTRQRWVALGSRSVPRRGRPSSGMAFMVGAWMGTGCWSGARASEPQRGFGRSSGKSSASGQSLRSRSGLLGYRHGHSGRTQRHCVANAVLRAREQEVAVKCEAGEEAQAGRWDLWHAGPSIEGSRRAGTLRLARRRQAAHAEAKEQLRAVTREIQDERQEAKALESEAAAHRLAGAAARAAVAPRWHRWEGREGAHGQRRRRRAPGRPGVRPRRRAAARAPEGSKCQAPEGWASAPR